MLASSSSNFPLIFKTSEKEEIIFAKPVTNQSTSSPTQRQLRGYFGNGISAANDWTHGTASTNIVL